MAKVDLIWIDVETTGLEVGVDKILEIGVALTDRFGGWVAGDSWLVGDENYEPIVKRAKVHEIVGPMHEKSGLWQEWDRVGRRNLGWMSYRPADVEARIIDFITSFGAKNGEHPMAGATIHFDRSMLAVQMPALEAFFHYRNFDISTIKQAARWLNPSCAEADQSFANDLILHRGYDDCVWEVHEYKHYIENFLFATEPEPEH